MRATADRSHRDAPSPGRLVAVIGLVLVLLATACGTGPAGTGTGEAGGNSPGTSGPPNPTGDRAPSDSPLSLRYDGEWVSYPWVGDIWTMAWPDQGDLYAFFGDGTGMSACLPTLLEGEPDEFDAAYEEVGPACWLPREPDNEYCQVFDCSKCLGQCLYTPHGALRLRGEVPRFEECSGKDQCVVSRHIPFGDLGVYEKSDKPSSVVAVGNRLYLHGHRPPGVAEEAYLAWSDDLARTWTVVEGDSPWGRGSPFLVVMFFSEGRGFTSDEDGWLYGLGIGAELPDDARPQDVHLLRVPVVTPTPDPGSDPILDYSAYEYLAGYQGGEPVWSPDPSAAVAVPGLTTIAQGAAMYHPGSGRYLFLSGWTGVAPASRLGGDTNDPVPVATLFSAPEPWGPWTEVGRFPGGYIAGLVPSGADGDRVWFTAAGGGPVNYNLNVGKLDLVPAGQS